MASTCACIERSVDHARPVRKDAPASANQIVAPLTGIGLFREITGYARNRRFGFEPYLRLFEETGEGRYERDGGRNALGTTG